MRRPQWKEVRMATGQECEGGGGGDAGREGGVIYMSRVSVGGGPCA